MNEKDQVKEKEGDNVGGRKQGHVRKEGAGRAGHVQEGGSEERLEEKDQKGGISV